ncbi:sulfate transporter 1.2-like [Tripterygium wilfordii]|uniref:Sulfate transporter 1.2-like n=1 Tax=Tripterygium wilfordii TaxID=458696 RepID=A0A7J7D2G6_TRIWF|nr:sulfate transporter 1.2-like [Tripterygium wilfordii]
MGAVGHSADEEQEKNETEMDIRSFSSSHRQTQNAPYIHKVGVPPKQNLLKELTTTVKETFFADDPLRHFKDQPKSKKIILGIQAVFPIFEWGRKYNLTKLRGDIIAGLTIASLCIPQDIGYAKLANLDGQYGLYSSFVPPLIYAFMGSSRDIAIGPVAVVSLLLGTLLQNEIDPIKNAKEYRRLAFTATFFAGLTQATLGIFRLGFLIDFLSHAAIVGFMGGAAITIALQQLKGFLGIKTFTKKTDIVHVMHSVFSTANHGWNWQTIVIGLSFLSFLLFAKYITSKVFRLILRWVTDEEEELQANYQPTIQFVIVEMSPVTDIDTSGIHALEDLYKGLQKRGIQLILANPGPVVIDKLHASNFHNVIGEDHIFLTVADAVSSCSPKLAEEDV